VCARLRHPPAGVRGFGPRRAGRYARARQAPPPACIVQIETPGGVAAADEIAAVPGVDALVLGCSDLSLRLGLPQRLDSPQLVDAAAAVRAAGTAFGVAGAGPPAALARLAGPDACLLICSTDIRLYAQAVDDVAAGLRSAYEVLHA
jgi:4-hydroxy-2-oxoheptanedioate aldolase